MLKFCPYCGNKILKADAAFCMECGKSLEAFMSVSGTSESPPEQKVAPVAPKKSAPVQQVSNNSIEEELKKCRQSAEEGFQLAVENYNKIKDTLVEESRNLTQTDAEQNEIQRIQKTRSSSRRKRKS